MVAAELDEAFVDRVDEHVVLVVGGDEGAMRTGVDLEGAAHPAPLEVARPQLGV